MKKSILVYCIFFNLVLNAQEAAIIRFVPRYGEKVVQLNDTIFLENNKWISVSSLRFYMSNVTANGADFNWKDETKVRLLDLEHLESLKISVPLKQYDNLSFLIGTDSLSNVSSEFSGALDPINGMYWTWNSGYINFKLEGSASQLTSRNHGFEFHLGGYLPPFQTAQSCSIHMEGIKDEYLVYIQLEQFLSKEQLDRESIIMIPGKRASELARILPSLFLFGK